MPDFCRDSKWRAGFAFFVCAAAFLAAPPLARADQPKATAVLTDSETVIGQPVQMQIKVTGTRGARPPGAIAVDGLDIRYSGQSQMIEGRNFSFSYSFVYTYTIMPERTGTFRIPSQQVLAAGRTLMTEPLTLRVVDDGAGGQADQPDENEDSQARSIPRGQLGFVDVVLGKTTAYVGEMIPVEVRIGFRSGLRLGSLGDAFTVAGQGFTSQALVQARQTQQVIGGQAYNVIIYKTAIAPVRSGKLELPPLEVNPVVLIPRPDRSRMPRDPFDDPFFQNFFNDPALMPSQQRELQLKSKVATIDVKPLPPNAPADFSGAIGFFQMEASAKPKSGQIGDPFTVTANVIGRGNFDRVNAPTLSDENGWHLYPPTAKFTKDDEVGISGQKQFEIVLTPNESKNAIPALSFSFFDPAKEKYVTLRSNAIPIQVSGGTAPTPTPATAANAPALKATPKPEDILDPINDWPGTGESFVPIYRRPLFWELQLLPLLALLGMIVWKWRQARLGDRDARRRAQLQHEAAELERRLRKKGAAPQSYYADATRAVQLKTALAENVNPNVVDADLAALAFHLDEPMRRRLDSLFQKKDELQYSGGRNGHGEVSSEQQQEVTELIEHLRV